TVSFNSSPALSDLRPMLWHNYGTPGPHVQLDLRYTSYLDLAAAPDGGALDAMPLYRACNKSRRQSIRYGLDAGITVSLTDDVDAFLDLYRATFARQDLSVDPVEMTLLSAACRNLAAEDRLRMFAASTADGALGSIAVFGLDAKRAYYLYGANSPEMRNEHCGTLALWQGLVALAAEGVRECDLEGINSPKRGYFKLSFGGDIRPYFRVTLAQ
ncbi:MAG: GNAT family N-acetyltransferase, partial [Pseudomonadota bacterium]